MQSSFMLAYFATAIHLMLFRYRAHYLNYKCLKDKIIDIITTVILSIDLLLR